MLNSNPFESHKLSNVPIPLLDGVHPSQNPVDAFSQPFFVQSSNSDNQIGLALRQPSFSSLCGSKMVTKNGQEIADKRDIGSPCVVFDDSLKSAITSHQNSFSSLYNFVTNEKPNAPSFPYADSPPVEISKSTNNISRAQKTQSLTGNIGLIDSLVEDNDSIATAQQTSAQTAQATPAAAPNINNLSLLDQLEEEDDDQNIKVLKRLTNNNMERWKQIGYVPRENIVPMCKTISHLYRSNLIRQEPINKFSQSFAVKVPSKPSPNQSDNSNNNNNNNNTTTDSENSKDSSNSGNCTSNNLTIKRTRCNSNEHITPIKSQVSIVTKKSDQQQQQLQQQQQQQQLQQQQQSGKGRSLASEFTVEALLDYQPTNDSGYKIELYGRLQQIVTDPEIAHFLNKVPPTASPEVLRKLNQLVVQCSQKLWMDEVHYLNSIIANFRDSAQALQSQLTDIERLYESEVDAIECKVERKGNQIFKEYLADVKRLDTEFQSDDTMRISYKPSEEILLMKRRLREMKQVYSLQRSSLNSNQAQAQAQKQHTSFPQQIIQDISQAQTVQQPQHSSFTSLLLQDVSQTPQLQHSSFTSLLLQDTPPLQQEKSSQTQNEQENISLSSQLLQDEPQHQQQQQQHKQQHSSLSEQLLQDDSHCSFYPQGQDDTSSLSLSSSLLSAEVIERLENEIRTKEAAEVAEAAVLLDQAYTEADRRLKERYTVRRALSRRRADLKLEEAELKRNRAIERLKQAQKLRERIQKAIAIGETEVSKVEITPLKMMDRSNDLELLDRLTQRVLDGSQIEESDYDTPRISK